MKPYPRNVRVRPPQIPAHLLGELGAVGQEKEPQPSPKAPRTFRLSARGLLWSGIGAGLILAAALIAGHRTPSRATAALGNGIELWAMRQNPSWFPLVPASLEPGALRQQRADASLRRSGYSSISGGLLYVPETFSSHDGSYDLLIHFHGNGDVVLESVIAAKLNAIVVVVNQGAGGTYYEQAYSADGAYEALLRQIQSTLESRGLSHPQLRRVALSSWGAGYGAVASILRSRHGQDPLDAVLAIDGIRANWLPERPGKMDARELRSFAQLAHASASGNLLFSITYSESSSQEAAGGRETASYLLDMAKTHGEVDESLSAAPAAVRLSAAKKLLPKEQQKLLVPWEEARVGAFHARGFYGDSPQHHMAHLFQMSSTVLPELASRWSLQTGVARRSDAFRLTPRGESTSAIGGRQSI